MRHDRVTLEVGDLQVPGAIEEAETFQSPHTGRDLRQLQVRFIVDDEAANDQIVDALRTHQKAVLADQTGQRTPFKPGRNSWSYSDGRTRVDFQVELTEQEDLQPSAVLLEQLELTPYAYEEEISDDGALVIELKVRVASMDHAALQAMILRHGSSDRSYFPVVRKGLQDAPRTMRFGKCTWSAQDGEFKHHLVLVEQPQDQHEPEPFLLDYPEGPRGRGMAAKALALVTELLQALEAKGVLDADEVRELNAAAERQRLELVHEFFRMEDIDAER